MINAVANSTVPHLTLILGASYGAGGYGMAGRAYDPRFLFTWPASKSAVMGPDQLAGVMSILNRASAESGGRPFDDEADRSMRERRPRPRRGRVPGPVQHRPAVRRRHHRPPRHPHRPRHRPVGLPLGGGEGHGRLRRVPDVIAKLLVANRGEIATRVLRTARSMGIATVAVFTDPDRDAPFVAEADEAVPLGAARLLPAGRGHPGRGPADRRRRRPPRLRVPGRARRVRRGGAATPACPGSGRRPRCWPPSATSSRPSGSRPPPGCRCSPGEAGRPARPATPAQRVGFPLLVKAAHGGGGIGMRVVRDPADLAEAVAAARRQAGAAFGDDEVFLERWLEAPRHVEIQLLADAHRPHGAPVRARVLDPAPPPEADRGGPVAGGRPGAARAPGRRPPWPWPRAVGYVGAGTVEFLLVRRRQFWFLEVNTRLQVEHPVTEAVTGLDLVRLQLLIAAGEPLRPEPPGSSSAATPSRPASTPRTRPTGSCRRPAPCTGSWSGPGRSGAPGRVRACGSTPAWTTGRWSGCTTTRCWPRSSPTPRPGRRRPGCWPRRWPAPGSTALVTNRDLLVGILRSDGVPRRRHRHRVPRPPPPGRADRGRWVGRPLADRAARRRRRPRRPGRPPRRRHRLPGRPLRLAQQPLPAPAGRPSRPPPVPAPGPGRLPLRPRRRPGRPGGRRRPARRVAPVALHAAPSGSRQPGGPGGRGVRRRFEVHRVGDHLYVDSPLGHSELRAPREDSEGSGGPDRPAVREAWGRSPRTGRPRLPCPGSSGGWRSGSGSGSRPGRSWSSSRR